MAFEQCVKSMSQGILVQRVQRGHSCCVWVWKALEDMFKDGKTLGYMANLYPYAFSSPWIEISSLAVIIGSAVRTDPAPGRSEELAKAVRCDGYKDFENETRELLGLTPPPWKWVSRESLLQGAAGAGQNCLNWPQDYSETSSGSLAKSSRFRKTPADFTLEFSKHQTQTIWQNLRCTLMRKTTGQQLEFSVVFENLLHFCRSLPTENKRQ